MWSGIPREAVEAACPLPIPCSMHLFHLAVTWPGSWLRQSQETDTNATAQGPAAMGDDHSYSAQHLRDPQCMVTQLAGSRAKILIQILHDSRSSREAIVA